jgi:hypothetical protein
METNGQFYTAAILLPWKKNGKILKIFKYVSKYKEMMMCMCVGKTLSITLCFYWLFWTDFSHLVNPTD